MEKVIVVAGHFEHGERFFVAVAHLELATEVYVVAVVVGSVVLPIEERILGFVDAGNFSFAIVVVVHVEVVEIEQVSVIEISKLVLKYQPS